MNQLFTVNKYFFVIYLMLTYTAWYVTNVLAHVHCKKYHFILERDNVSGVTENTVL